MTDFDAYFTQTIVGAPFSTVLGRRLSPAQAQAQGIEVPLDGSAARLTAAWRDWVILRGQDGGGLPHRKPTPLRRWVERQALVIAGLGLLTLLFTASWALWLTLS